MRHSHRRNGQTQAGLYRRCPSGRATLKCISRNERNFVDKIGNPDAIIVFTNKVSHEAKRKALLHARSRNIPIHLVHSCGVSSLRDCLSSS